MLVQKVAHVRLRLLPWDGASLLSRADEPPDRQVIIEHLHTEYGSPDAYQVKSRNIMSCTPSESQVIARAD